MSLIL